MPKLFHYKGWPIQYHNDTCYLITTKNKIEVFEIDKILVDNKGELLILTKIEFDELYAQCF